MARTTEVRRLKLKKSPPMPWPNHTREVEEGQERFILGFTGIVLGLSVFIPLLIRLANMVAGDPVLY